MQLMQLAGSMGFDYTRHALFRMQRKVWSGSPAAQGRAAASCSGTYSVLHDVTSVGAYIPSSFLALPSAFIDSSCLPSLWNFSPSARSALTLVRSSVESVGLVESLASIAFNMLGQLVAQARDEAARASAAMMSFMSVSVTSQKMLTF